MLTATTARTATKLTGLIYCENVWRRWYVNGNGLVSADIPMIMLLVPQLLLLQLLQGVTGNTQVTDGNVTGDLEEMVRYLSVL